MRAIWPLRHSFNQSFVHSQLPVSCYPLPACTEHFSARLCYRSDRAHILYLERVPPLFLSNFLSMCHADKSGKSIPFTSLVPQTPTRNRAVVSHVYILEKTEHLLGHKTPPTEKKKSPSFRILRPAQEFLRGVQVSSRLSRRAGSLGPTCVEFLHVRLLDGLKTGASSCSLLQERFLALLQYLLVPTSRAQSSSPSPSSWTRYASRDPKLSPASFERPPVVSSTSFIDRSVEIAWIDAENVHKEKPLGEKIERRSPRAVLFSKRSFRDLDLAAPKRPKDIQTISSQFSSLNSMRKEFFSRGGQTAAGARLGVIHSGKVGDLFRPRLQKSPIETGKIQDSTSKHWWSTVRTFTES